MKKNLFVLSEREKSRILNMHKSATKRNYVFEQATTPDDPNKTAVTGNQGAAVTGAVTPTNSVSNIPTQTAPSAGATPPAGATPEKNTIMLNDLDYEYKKDGDKYFFKIKANAKTPKLQELLKQGKFKDFTEAKPGTKSYDSISKLNWAKGDKLDVKSASSMKVTSPNLTASPQGGTTPVAGSSPMQIQDPIGDAKKLMPNIGSLDATKQKEVAAWSTSPAGKHILALPADQREGALDNLEKKSGDQTTKALKTDIRTALGMAADTAFQRLGQGIKGAVAGFKAGAQGQQPPATT